MAGFIALGAFLAPEVFIPTGTFNTEVRIITTSVKDDHLRVLWGEIGRFIQTVRPDFPLLADRGGPLIVLHRDIRKLSNVKERTECKISYLRGMVSERGEGMAGHHAAHSLCIVDESTGVDDLTYTQQGTWAKRLLALSNPNPTAPTHWFHAGVKAGDLSATK